MDHEGDLLGTEEFSRNAANGKHWESHERMPCCEAKWRVRRMRNCSAPWTTYLLPLSPQPFSLMRPSDMLFVIGLAIMASPLTRMVQSRIGRYIADVAINQDILFLAESRIQVIKKR
jgi:hypothetical protein